MCAVVSQGVARELHLWLATRRPASKGFGKAATDEQGLPAALTDPLVATAGMRVKNCVR